MRGIVLLMVLTLAIVLETHCASFGLGGLGRKIEETAKNTKRQAQIIFSDVKSAIVGKPATTTIPPTTKTTTVRSTEHNGATTAATPLLLNTTAKAIVITCKPDSVTSGSSLPDDYIRMKLCPNATSRDYRFDPETKLCSLAGQRSHCGKNMVFYSAGNVFGHCDCDYSSKFPLLYHAETNRCYFMYQQAFCGDGKWLEMRKEDRQGICTNNTCYNAGRSKFGQQPLAARDMEPEYVPLKGVGPCVKLNQPNQQFCKRKGEVVAFRWPLEFYPNCGVPIIPALPEGPVMRFLGDVPSLQCSPGSYLDMVGHCQPHWDFD
ncbi:unnamed protein product [Orchesella dallaii]|uniref:DUF4789 domain-containing protein n=1 Tax=Orchesella dallaii TaxID=48710 RepID=A0ABP1QU45_9HEXA